MPRSWFPDELVHAGRENLDPGHVAHYDEKEDSGAVAELELLERLGLASDSVLVEFGPGTGQLAVAAAERCRRVVAVDVSAPMLERLRSRAEAAGTTNLEPVNAGFLSYSHTGAPADIAYSRLALHHLPDAWKVIALRRVRRVLRTGGVFRLSDVAYSFDAADAEERLEAWAASYPPATESTWGREDVEEHIRDEHSTYTWLLEPMIERAGFEIEAAEHAASGVFADYVLRAA